MVAGFSNFLHDALDCVQQNSTIKEFYHHFEAIWLLVSSIQPWLPEVCFAAHFIYGLQEDTQGYVFKCHPFIVIDVFHLAYIY